LCLGTKKSSIINLLERFKKALQRTKTEMPPRFAISVEHTVVKCLLRPQSLVTVGRHCDGILTGAPCCVELAPSNVHVTCPSHLQETSKVADLE
jgi:hypothetical protein